MLASGNYICTTPMCDAGEASVSQMDIVFRSLPAGLQNQFRSTHDNIMDNLASVASWYSDWIPFNPNCCTIQEIGQQADNLTHQMQVANGQVPSGPLSDPGGMSLTSMVVLGVLGFLALTHFANRI